MRQRADEGLQGIHPSCRGSNDNESRDRHSLLLREEAPDTMLACRAEEKGDDKIGAASVLYIHPLVVLRA